MCACVCACCFPALSSPFCIVHCNFGDEASQTIFLLCQRLSLRWQQYEGQEGSAGLCGEGDLAVALSLLWLLSMSSFCAYQPSHTSLSWQQKLIPVAAAKSICGSSNTWETASVPPWDRCQFLWAAAVAQKHFGAPFPGAETSSSSAELCLLHGGLNCNSTLQASKFLIIQIFSLSCRFSFHKKLLLRHASTCRKFVRRKHLWEKMGRKPGGTRRTVRPWCVGLRLSAEERKGRSFGWKHFSLWRSSKKDLAMLPGSP